MFYDYKYQQRCPVRCPAGSFPYTIKAGDTLYFIARTYNTTVEAIMAINPGLDPYNLQIGQVICVPTMAPPVPPCPGGFYYTIQPGDTLYLIGQRFNVTVDALIRANPGIDPNNLQIGQVICIPASQPLPPCPGGFYYTIKAGDTLYNLAQQFNVTVSAIIAANPGIDPNNLRVGQIICIPAPPPISCPGGQIYVVKENDNLASILVKFDISVADLLVGNPDLDINRIIQGQKLCILPHKSRTCPSGETYVITCQDIKPDTPTVVVIAEKFVVSVSDLMIVNPDLAPSDFIEGTRVCIPSEKAPV